MLHVVWTLLQGVSGDNPSLSWQQPISYAGSQWKTAEGSCVLNDRSSNTSLHHQHHQQQNVHKSNLDNGFGTHPEKGCVPRCFTFAKSNVNGVEIAEGAACDDRVNYNILEIKKHF